MEQLRKSLVAVSSPLVVSASVTERVQPPAESVQQRRKRALVVEATASSLRLCRDILQGSGFIIECTHSGIEALTSARDDYPDLVVMDLQLPDVPGCEFIAWIRSIAALRSTPIIVLAGSTGDHPELAKLGPNTLLRRPVSALAIHRAIREALKVN